MYSNKLDEKQIDTIKVAFKVDEAVLFGSRGYSINIEADLGNAV